MSSQGAAGSDGTAEVQACPGVGSGAWQLPCPWALA